MLLFLTLLSKFLFKSVDASSVGRFVEPRISGRIGAGPRSSEVEVTGPGLEVCVAAPSVFFGTGSSDSFGFNRHVEPPRMDEPNGAKDKVRHLLRTNNFFNISCNLTSFLDIYFPNNNNIHLLLFFS